MLISKNARLHLEEARSVYVAFSGGLDSHVLLHQLAQLTLNSPIKAIHCHHHLHAASDQWAQHCANICYDLGIDYLCIDLAFDGRRNIEAQARTARYAAFKNLLQENDSLLTAHHQGDQAETLLLQLCRGTGIQGLNSILEKQSFGKGTLFRPLLSQPRAALEKYAAEHKLNWIKDDSNEDTCLRRNFIRHEIIPLLETQWPGVKKTLARTAEHAQAAQALLNELAFYDYQKAYQSAHQQASLDLNYLSSLHADRQKNLMRYALARHQFQALESAQLESLLTMMLTANSDQQPLFQTERLECRRFQNRLYFSAPLPSFEKQDWELSDDTHTSLLEALDKTKLSKTCYLKFRSGGERFHPQDRLHSQCLKKLMQEWQIPPWLRERIPLLYHGDELIAVVGYAVHKDYAK